MILQHPTKYWLISLGYKFLQDAGYVFHPGVDYNWGYGWQDQGTPVYPMTEGVVVFVDTEGDNAGWGQHVYVKHYIMGEWVYTHYAHMRNVKVKAGDWVDNSTQIGEVSNTGGNLWDKIKRIFVPKWSPHLHFEIINKDTYDTLMNLNPTFYPTKKGGFTKNMIAGMYKDPFKYIEETNNKIMSYTAEDLALIEWAQAMGIAKVTRPEVLGAPCNKLDTMKMDNRIFNILIRRIELLEQKLSKYNLND